ncbi:hypothetical protein [Frondihabitans australicus]|uniref:Uncharacterized protein n=1 Tax=Frondihabitans australicus TaxID=386892 RepID=A0A495II87_9MICO|nr:hypothetical protein [Frondihabitans australicus]RKR75752.1 hypothetical protein C8E83_2907 [Frondihabitans australicus]
MSIHSEPLSAEQLTSAERDLVAELSATVARLFSVGHDGREATAL